LLSLARLATEGAAMRAARAAAPAAVPRVLAHEPGLSMLATEFVEVGHAAARVCMCVCVCVCVCLLRALLAGNAL
jgi:hypothetical protein